MKIFCYSLQEESEEEEEEEEETEEAVDTSGMQTPIIDAGLATPSGMSSVGAPGQETPELIELRKRKIEADMEGGDTPSLYTILPEKKADRIGASMMGSTHTYDVPSAAPSGRRLVLVLIKILLIDFQRAVSLKVRSFCVAIYLENYCLGEIDERV